MELNEILEIHRKRIYENNEIGDNVLIPRPDLVNIYGAKIGSESRIGPFVEIQRGAVIGNRVKVQSHSFICDGVNIEDCCFIGHGVVFTNDKNPSSVNSDGSLKTDADWTLERTLVREGANIGSGSTILPGITLAKRCLIGAGSVVTKDTVENGIYKGNPAKHSGYVIE